jgi:ribosome-associated protein
MHDDDWEFEEDSDYKSKSQVKREMTELQELGVKLTELPKELILQLNLEPRLLEAIEEYKRINHKNAQKRHRQFIGKLMRSADSEAIEALITRLEQEQLRVTRQFHNAEKWREKMLSDSASLSDFIAQHPEVDIQQLRSLHRAVLKDLQTNKKSGASKKLFRLILGTLSQIQH